MARRSDFVIHPYKRRRIFELHQSEGLTFETLSERFSIPPQTINTIIQQERRAAAKTKRPA